MSLAAMKQALAALELWCPAMGHALNKRAEAVVALRAAIEQAQEPVAWMTFNAAGEEDDIWYENPDGKLLQGWTYKPLYTSPRQWQGLTEKEIARREKVKPILVRIMQEAYDLADRDDSEGYNSVKVMCSDVLAMINELLDERQWQSLTDEDREEILRWVEWKEIGSQSVAPQKLIAYVEKKLREKNT